MTLSTAKGLTIGSGSGEAITAGTGTVRLSAGNTVSEAAGSIITATSLGVIATAGNITLTNSNNVDPANAGGTFMAYDTAGPINKFNDITTGTLTVGTVTADGTLFVPLAQGVTTSTGGCKRQ